MRRSFVRLVVGTVLLFWLCMFVLAVFVSHRMSWLDQRARTDGVFLAHELLDDTPPGQRAARLAELRQHFRVDLNLMTTQDVEALLERRVDAGEQIPRHVSNREQWYYFVFHDGSGVLAAGPVHASIPPGATPHGVFVAIFIVPVIAGLLAVRVEREVRKVEKASEALASGHLGARVENEAGPSAELAAKFNAMAERVERLIRSRDELVQAVSHELGSPLSRLRFHVELLQGDGTNPQTAERLEAMARELDQLDELVAELLTYVQSDDSALDLRTFDPSQGLSDLVELSVLDNDDCEIELQLDRNITINADQRLFLRAIENLLRNATTHANSRVLLEMRRDKDFVIVTVHDDGPGIPEEARASVTAPFTRLQSDRGRGSGGAGLGLAIVSRIIERHQGEMRIDDSPLRGTLVCTRWPGGALL